MLTLTDMTLSGQGADVYTVRSIDVAGNVSAPSNTLTVIYDTTPPHTPSGLTVRMPTKLPHLTWDAAQDDDSGASGLDHYKIYRDWLLVGQTPTTSFDDSSVPDDGSFGYSVTAVDRARQREPLLAHGDHPVRRHAALSPLSPAPVVPLQWR